MFFTKGRNAHITELGSIKELGKGGDCWRASGNVVCLTAKDIMLFLEKQYDYFIFGYLQRAVLSVQSLTECNCLSCFLDMM